MDEDRLRRLVEERAGPVPDEAWEYFRDRGLLEPAAWDPHTAAADVAAEVRAMREAGLLDRLPRRRGPRADGPRAAAPDERRLTLARILAAEAARRQDVAAFRREVLGDRLLPREEVGPWIRAQAEGEGPPTSWFRFALPDEVEVDPRMGAEDMLRLAGGRAASQRWRLEVEALDYAEVGSPWVQRVPIRAGGTLARLKEVATRLSRHYGWREAAATTFVLTGAVPAVPPATIAVRTAPAAPALARIELSLDPRLSPQEVATLYARERRRFLGPGRQDRVLSAKHLELAAHVAEQGTDAGGWEGLLASWNAAFPQWSYRGPGALGRFSRDARVAWTRVTGRRWPGLRRALWGVDAGAYVRALGRLVGSPAHEAGEGDDDGAEEEGE